MYEARMKKGLIVLQILSLFLAISCIFQARDKNEILQCIEIEKEFVKHILECRKKSYSKSRYERDLEIERHFSLSINEIEHIIKNDMLFINKKKIKNDVEIIDNVLQVLMIPDPKLEGKCNIFSHKELMKSMINHDRLMVLLKANIK